MNNMSIDWDLVQEFKEELVDRYEPLELMELIIDHFNLTAWDVLEMVGDEKIIELKWR